MQTIAEIKNLGNLKAKIYEERKEPGYATSKMCCLDVIVHSLQSISINKSYVA